MFNIALTHFLAAAPLPLASFATVMWSLLSVVLVVTCILLILIVLLQDPKSAGLSSAFGAGGGGNDSILGAQAQRGVSRFTAVLAITFASLCVALVLIDKHLIERSPGAVGAANTEAPAPDDANPFDNAAFEDLDLGTSDDLTPGGDADGVTPIVVPPDDGNTDVDSPPADSGDAGDTRTPSTGGSSGGGQ